MRTINDILLNENKDVTFSSDVIDLEHYSAMSMQVTTSSASSLNFSVQLQISNDNINFIDNGSPTVLNSNTSVLFEDTNITYRYTKLVCTRTAGSAVFKINLHAKGF